MASDSDIERFRQLILERSGLKLRDDDINGIGKILHGRMKALHLSEPEQYLDMLGQESLASRGEWEALSPLITVAETFFFRDKGQMGLLRDWVLPELIKKHQHDRRLRLWSAGCSIGAEPYSIAMLLDQLLPNLADWDIFILGTDLNGEVIEKARKGVFLPWAFRQVAVEIQENYFSASQGRWKINDNIRKMVTFRTGDLTRDGFPGMASNIHDMDLILCRNVFIYFDRQSIKRAAAKMIQTLNDGGYLMTGHAELMGIELPGLNKRLFSESLLYQRGIDSSAVLPPPVTVSRPVATRIKRPAEHKPQRARQTPVVKPEVVKTQQVNKAQEGTSARLTELKNLMARHDYLSVVEKAAVEPKSSQHFPDIACFRAEAYANLGDYDKAAATCRQIIEAKPFHCRAHYLLAQVTEAQGDQKSAVQLFKKVIYLDPLFIPGYLELASLLHASDSSASARKMWSAALKVLKKMPSNEVVECYEEMNIDELTRHVEMMMGEAG